MAAWTETSSQNFAARFDEADGDAVGGVLELLEQTRERLGGLFPRLPSDVTVVLHSSRVQLDVAQPYLPLLRRATTPSARRYVAGWAARGALHVLTPRLLAERASNVEGSREVLARTPAALYVQLAVAACNPHLPPPWSPRSTLRAARWAWLQAGTAQWFSRQTAFAGAAIARRMRDDGRPEFPPGLKDAVLLGGTVIDLLVREEGIESAVALACSRLPKGGSRQALLAAFDGRATVHTEGTWRAHLARMADG
jgi:hypothetical protein